MCKKLIYLISFVVVLVLSASVTYAAPLQQEPGPNGIVSVEAEHFDANVEQSGLIWEETGPTGGFTGTAGMRATEGYQTDYAARSPRLDYEVNFVKTGTYYPWILGWAPDGNSDTCHVGLDGQEIATSDQVDFPSPAYEWTNDTRDPERASFEVPSIGVHTLNIWMRERNLIIDKIVLTTNPDYTLTGTEPGPPESTRGARVVASNPIPTDGATDVPRDVVLSWTEGAHADKHDVYFGTNFNDVNDADRTNPLGVLVSQNQVPNSYSLAAVLQWEQTYYWRVDEVNAPPDFTIFKGGVWQFMVEPFTYPIAGTSITATASSQFNEKTKPENTINGSGLDDNDLHSKEEADIWVSSMTGPQPTWIQYEFDRVYKLHQMWVWNYNTSIESVVGFGVKDATIEYSSDGANWTTLDTTHEFARAPGAAGYAHNTTIDLSGVVAKYVKITANSNWGGIIPQYGLSEVRFFHIPVVAREPDPASGTTDVPIATIGQPIDMTLSFRAGREAASHNVYFSTDEQAVIDGTAPVTTVSQASYGPLSLDLGQTYYWRVDEVNEAETPATWQGDVWNFSTQEYLVVDDFEDYNDFEPDRIFDTWIDGWGVPANGSQVGYAEPMFVETTIVHGGKQSMPFFYDNSTASYSEGAANVANLLIGQDWTKYGIKTLSLWFYGAPTNTVEQMYVKLNGSKVTYDGDASNLTRGGWQVWNIELASFGVNLSNVTELSIGLERSGAVGGSGMVYFDDIRLYPYSRQLATPVEPNQANLVGYWKLDEGAGTIAFDSSGLGHDGTLVGDPQWTAGKIGGALAFDGDDYVDLGNPSELDFGTASWSVSAWIKMPATTDNMNIFAKGGDNTGGIRYLLNVSETDDHKACLTVDDDVTKVQSTSSITVDDDQWHHIVGMRDGSSLRLYVDGVQDGAVVPLSDGYDLSGTSQANAYIGTGWRYDTSVLHKFLIGVIDDVRVYAYALSDAEVAWLVGKTKPFDKPF